jgi:hypothetical protein
MVAPKYFLPYQPDGVHLTNYGEELLGEYYAKAINQTIFQGRDWKPMYIIGCTLSGRVLNCVYNVPTGSIAIDTSTVTTPNGPAVGFEWFDDASSASVESVSIHDARSLDVVLDNVPTGSNRKLVYAYTGIPGSRAGPNSGTRGCVRDSETRMSRLTGQPLYDWAVHQIVNVP